MIRNPFARTRRPRPTDPEPYTRLDYLDGLPGRTRYDAEWPSVLAAEVVFAPHSFVGGDLAAMAAPLPGMARDDLGAYAEPVTGADAFDLIFDRLMTAPVPYAEPVKPRGRHRQTGRGRHRQTGRGRHRQTGPTDLILADLRDLDGL